VDSVVTGVVGLQGRSPHLAQEKIPALSQILQAEQDELKQFDAEIGKSSVI
jgi:predicted aconitase